MNRERKLSAVKRVLGEPKIVKGDEHVFYCPRPEHDGRKKLKLSVNLETDRFNCWSCGFKGHTLAGILKLISRNPDLEEYLDEHVETKQPASQAVAKPVELPGEYQPLAGCRPDLISKAYLLYLKSRKIGVQDIYRNRIGFAASGPYGGRIVVPSFDANGALNTFTARTIYDGVQPKYDFPDVDKTSVVFNELMVDWNKPIILVEGVLDAIVGGDNVVPLCGKTLSKRSVLFKKLVKSGQPIYVALDPDANEEAIDICEDLTAYSLEARFVPMRDLDPAASGRSVFRDIVSRAIPVTDKFWALEARRRMMK